MTSLIVQVERWNETGWAFIRVQRFGDAPETNVIRCIDPNHIFRETPIPAECRIRAGALTLRLLFGYSQRTVLQDRNPLVQMASASGSSTPSLTTATRRCTGAEPPRRRSMRWSRCRSISKSTRRPRRFAPRSKRGALFFSLEFPTLDNRACAWYTTSVIAIYARRSR
jgi:hypothetical protein